MRKLVFIILLLFVIAACTGGQRHEQMLQQLSELERQNVADSVMTNESLAEALVDYFDRHGSANERLRAHYILGRTYADLGEAPAAISAYLDAADCADTTAADCDFAKLSRVYGQMADVFYWQNLMDDYIDACDHSIYCAWKARDTIQAVNQMALKIAAYEQLDMPSKVIDLSNALFSEFGNNQNVGMVLARTSLVPLRHLLEDGYIEQAKRYLLLYETASGFFETNGQIISGMEVYYYYKGLYYSYVEQFDSAEYFYRKELLEGKDFLNQNMASYGLANLYSQRNMPDSSAKYALYSYAMSDSVNRNQAMEEVENAKALYNYSRHQGLANKEHQNALQERKAKEFWFVMAFVLLLLFVVSYAYWRKKKELQLLQYQNDLADMEKAQTRLMQLHSEETDNLSVTINGLREEIESMQQRIDDYHRKSDRQLEALERRIQDSAIVERLKNLANSNPPQEAGPDDMKELRMLMNELIPHFYLAINKPDSKIRLQEYEVCLLTRAHFSPIEICWLLGISRDYISNLRKRILYKINKTEGQAKDFDAFILSIH